MKQNLSIPHLQDQAEADYQIFWIIRQYLYCPKILQIIFCCCLHIWAAQLITGVFHLDISLSCWFKGIQVPFQFLWSLFSFLKWGLWRTWPQWIRSLHGWRCWCSRRQKVRTHHNGQWKGTLACLSEGLPGFRLFSSRLKNFYCIYMDNHGKQYYDQGTDNYLGDTIPPKVLEEFHTEGLQKDVIGVMKYSDRAPHFILLLQFWYWFVKINSDFDCG